MLNKFITWLYDKRKNQHSLILVQHTVKPHFTRPRIHLLGNVVFLILVSFTVLILFEEIKRSFAANPFLNGLIVFVLALGILKSFNQIKAINFEISWVNETFEPTLIKQPKPVLLAPLANLLHNKIVKNESLIISLDNQSRILGSVAGRMDEDRSTSRYMIGLLVFLGLLGTFWGLLQTVASVGDTIQSLDIKTNDAGVVFDTLRGGLQAPLAGMSTAFASSLFGLSGSLILGFLDLQSGKSQARFLDDLEDFVSEIGTTKPETDDEVADFQPSGTRKSFIRTPPTLE